MRAAEAEAPGVAQEGVCQAPGAARFAARTGSQTDRHLDISVHSLQTDFLDLHGRLWLDTSQDYVFASKLHRAPLSRLAPVAAHHGLTAGPPARTSMNGDVNTQTLIASHLRSRFLVGTVSRSPDDVEGRSVARVHSPAALRGCTALCAGVPPSYNLVLILTRHTLARAGLANRLY